jgi:hypothetical protein
MTITGPNPPDPNAVFDISIFGLLALGLFYAILGFGISVLCGLAIGSIVGFLKALLNLFKSQTAWFACVTMLAIAYFSFFYGAGGLVFLAGLLGDKTGYQMQGMLLLGGLVGLISWIMSVIAFVSVSKRLVSQPSYGPYGFIYGMFVTLGCWLLGFLIVMGFLIKNLSIAGLAAALVFYPLTFVIAPLYMALINGLWWPLILNWGGIFAGLVLMFSGRKWVESVKS